MRLCVDRGRQHAERGRAVGEARAHRRSGRGSLGMNSMQRTKPPLRADHVGSFLRTAPIKEARAKRVTGAITADGLKAVEDIEIRRIIARQEECGLKLATDGEFRRSWWHFDFLCGL